MPKAPVLLDFESRSRASLKTIGGRLYWEHASTEALLCCWHDLADGSSGTWVPGEPWPFAGTDRVLAAHNAKHFDAHGARRYGFRAARWIDTSDLARRGGLPGKLEVLGDRLGYPKDTDASRFVKGLSTVRRPPTPKPAPKGWAKMTDAERYALGTPWISAADWRDELTDEERRAWGVQTELTEDVLARVEAYCQRDVEVMVRAWPDLADFLDVDADVGDLDGTINDRGVPMDRALLERIVALEDERFERVLDAESKRAQLSVEDMRAIATRPAWIAELLGLPSADKVALAPFVDHPVVRVRQAAASIIRGKAIAGLARTSADDRMRDALQYHAAHTGRWGGRGFQPHNLNKAKGKDADGGEYEDYEDDDVCRLCESALIGANVDAAAMPILLRGAIAAPPGKRLIVNDFSGVEARATGWAAGDEATLDVFCTGADPYKAAAVDIYGVEYDDVTKAQRQIGKVAVLALGYQGGVGAFSKMASGYGIDVSELDVQLIVDAWRAAHRPTVSLWYACQRAFVAACTDGRTTHVGPFEFCPGTDGSVAVFLPSGRPLVYRDAEAHQSTSYDSGRPRWSCTHYGQIKSGLWGTVHTYGGKLVENLIQALCRDLMAHAMLACEAAGLPVVLTVHDEIISEVAEREAADAYAEHRRIMSTPPAWARDFPLTADGFFGRRYRK